MILKIRKNYSFLGLVLPLAEPNLTAFSNLTFVDLIVLAHSNNTINILLFNAIKTFNLI